MMGKSALEFLILSIFSIGLVVGCLEEFQIHNDKQQGPQSTTVKKYPNNENQIINLAITCCKIWSIYEYNYTFEHLNVPQTLIIANRKISQIPLLPKWTGITEIKFLAFRNKIINDGAFKNLPKLKKLDFTHCATNKLPNIRLTGVGTLENLILSHNSIKEVDEILDAEEIHLDGNPITTINVPFENVRVLNLSGTALQVVKKSYFKHPEKLEKLYLTKSNISKIFQDSLRKMYNLEELHVDRNKITSLDDYVFADLSNLKILKLSFNSIQYLQIGLFENLKNLKHLNIGFNFVKTLDKKLLTNLTNLEILDIQNNKVKILDGELLNTLVNLIRFDLNNNDVDWWEVREIKRHNPNLNEVNLIWNKWICDDLAFIVKHLKIQNITLDKLDRVEPIYGRPDESHLDGIPCIKQDILHPQCTK